ncbi:MAG: DUF4114 domain-containing protein [Cyanobacteria bacterium P01_D01_bin.1]
MKRSLLNISLLAATSLSFLTATVTKAETVTDSANLRGSDVELFDLFNGFVNAERLALDESALPELYADSLRWDPIASSVDIFFINEGAGYRNQLMYAINGGERTTLFDDIASTESIIKETTAKVEKYENQVAKLGSEISTLETEIASGNLTAEERSAKQEQLSDKQAKQSAKAEFLAVEKTLGNDGIGALSLGDGKSIGGLSGDVAFDFFIKADGARREDGYIYGADVSENPDGLQHVIARELQYEGDSWVLIGFEDLYGVHEDEGGISDRDFNDVVFAVRGLTGDRVDPEQIPEPSTAVGLLVFGALGLAQTRRRKSAAG